MGGGGGFGLLSKPQVTSFMDGPLSQALPNDHYSHACKFLVPSSGLKPEGRGDVKNCTPFTLNLIYEEKHYKIKGISFKPSLLHKKECKSHLSRTYNKASAITKREF